MCKVSIPYRRNEIGIASEFVQAVTTFQFLIGAMKCDVRPQFKYTESGFQFLIGAMKFYRDPIICNIYYVSIPYRRNEITTSQPLYNNPYAFQFLIGAMKCKKIYLDDEQVVYVSIPYRRNEISSSPFAFNAFGIVSIPYRRNEINSVGIPGEINIMFQFLIGAMKWQMAVQVAEAIESFNSL